MFNPTSVCILPTLISLLIFLFYFQETKTISGMCVVLDVNSPSFICSWKFGAAFVLALALEVLMYIRTMFVMKELFLTYCETLFFDSQVSNLPKQIGNSENNHRSVYVIQLERKNTVFFWYLCQGLFLSFVSWWFNVLKQSLEQYPLQVTMYFVDRRGTQLLAFNFILDSGPKCLNTLFSSSHVSFLSSTSVCIWHPMCLGLLVFVTPIRRQEKMPW